MKYIIFIVLTIPFLSCHKADDRKCIKSFGEITEITYPIDSVSEFELYKNIKYNFYQNDNKKIVVRTGKNLQNFINIKQHNYTTTITKTNTCNFLRKNTNKVEVDIHYPKYYKIYAEPTDSMIFKDTLKGDFTSIQLRDGGGTLKLNTNMNQLNIGISYGVGNFILGGFTDHAFLSIQNLAYGDALNLKSKKINIYHNSNNDLRVNFDSSIVNVYFYANGDVRFIGDPSSLSVNGVGDGEVISY